MQDAPLIRGEMARDAGYHLDTHPPSFRADISSFPSSLPLSSRLVYCGGQLNLRVPMRQTRNLHNHTTPSRS
jgi:hypothetical protein